MPAIQVTGAPLPTPKDTVIGKAAITGALGRTTEAITGQRSEVEERFSGMVGNSVLSFKQVWECLPFADQRAACIAAFASDSDPISKEVRPMLTEALAGFYRFRKRFFEKKSVLERATFLADAMRDQDFPFVSIPLRSWLMSHHVGMIKEFLDDLGIVHRGGLIQTECKPSTADELARALRRIASKYPPLPVGVYIAFLCIHEIDVFVEARNALEVSGIDVRVLLGMKEGPLPQTVYSENLDNEFTTLDHVLTRAIVATACGEQGALTPAQLEDLVEESIEMSSARHRTLFHRGFLHALLSKPFEFHFPGENDSRRLWYFTGVLMGLLRSGEPDRCLDLLAAEHQLGVMLTSASGASCGTLLLPHLHSALIRAGKAALTCAWARAQLPAVPIHQRPRLLASFQGLGEELLVRSQLPEATLVLELVRDFVCSRHGAPSEYSATARPRNARTLAQVLQARGNFDQATPMLRELASSRSDRDAAWALGDLGLVQSGFRNLESILPRSAEEANVPLAKALEKGRASFTESIGRCPDAAVTAHLCLGMRAFVVKPAQPAAAAEHLREALQLMVRDQSFQREGPGSQLLLWARFALGVSLLETLDQASMQLAGDLINHALAAPVTIPGYLWARALTAASLFDDQSLAERLCQRLIEQSDSRAFDLLASTGLYRKSAPLRGVYLEWLCRAPLPIDRRWAELRSLLEAALEHSDLGAAEQALDQIESIAMELSPQRRELVTMLDSPAWYSPAWAPEDADACRTRLLEMDGEYAAAAQVLLRRFHRARATGAEHQLAHARDLLDLIAAYQVPGIDVQPLRNLVAVEQADAPASTMDALRGGARARVLYVGGNEKQKASEADLLREFADLYPGLEVTFMFPGFSSNWRGYIDEVERLIPAVDAVCLSFLVRTTFGRHVRALCNTTTPWFPCTGGGKQCIRRSIERAALWAVSRA